MHTPFTQRFTAVFAKVRRGFLARHCETLREKELDIMLRKFCYKHPRGVYWQPFYFTPTHTSESSPGPNRSRKKLRCCKLCFFTTSSAAGYSTPGASR